MPVHVEPNNLRDVLLFECPNGYSRTSMTLNVTEIGSVVNINGDLIDPAGSAAEKKAVGVVVGTNIIIDIYAIILSKGLIYREGVTDLQKAASLVDLRSIGLKSR